MKEMYIEYGVHPLEQYHEIKVTWLVIKEGPNATHRVNVDYGVETLTKYSLGTDLDLFEYLQAIELLKPFPQKLALNDSLRSLKQSTRTYETA